MTPPVTASRPRSERRVWFHVVDQAPDQFVIVPDGHDSLPAIFRGRHGAQEIARQMDHEAFVHPHKRPTLSVDRRRRYLRWYALHRLS